MKKATKNGLEAEIYERQVRICKAFANATRLRAQIRSGRKLPI